MLPLLVALVFLVNLGGCAEARRGQILVGPETAQRVHGHVPLRRLGPRLKNVEAAVDVWEVDDATTMATSA